MVSVIVPTLCVGMHPVTLCVTILTADAERPERHSHAERGNDLNRQQLCPMKQTNIPLW